MFTMRPYRICVFLIILLGTEISGEFPWQSDFAVKSSICHSPECDAQAKYFHSFLNYDVNPCNDFYQHVCGKWGQIYPLSDHYPQWSIDIQISERGFDRLKNILDHPIPPHLNSKKLRQSKALYEACMNIPYLGILEAPALRNYINVDNFPLIMSDTETVKAPELSWLEVHNYYLSITGEPAFFSIGIVADSGEQMKPTLSVSCMESPFGLIESLKELKTQKLILYRNFLMRTIIHLMPLEVSKVSYPFLKKRLVDVLLFRRELWKLTPENKPNADACLIMTMKTFKSLYTSRKEISWANMIYSMYNTTNDPLSINSMKICTEKKKYFNSLTRLLSETDDETLVNHIHLYFIERHLKLTPHLREMLMKVVIQNGKLEEKIRYLTKKEVECITIGEITDGFGKVYVDKYFPSEIKKQGELLVNKIKDMMKIQISQSTWLDVDMMKKTMDKIGNMTITIGYPEYYDHPELETYEDPEERVRAITSDLFYFTGTNHLSISAAFFNSPLYDLTFPPSVVYGTIGTSVAHEMYHAFGPSTLYCKSLPAYWSKEMLSKYKKKTECYVEQYDNKPVKGLRHVFNAPRTNGRRTLDENLSDSMGLNLGYWTFRKEVWTSKMCEVLKGPPNLTCDQMFFVSYASNFCSTVTLDRLMDLVQNEEHCPDSLRVNGAVSNLEEFSKAFNCPKGAPMNPSKRCNLWM